MFDFISPDDATILQGIASLLSIIVAIFFPLYLFRKERKTTLQIAEANAKPLLDTLRLKYTNEKAVSLVNLGVGTAIITEMWFERKGVRKSGIVDLIELDTKIVWNTYKSGIKYVGADSEKFLIKITQERLEKSIPKLKAIEILKSIDMQLSEIEIIVEYVDIFQNKQPSIRKRL